MAGAALAVAAARPGRAQPGASVWSEALGAEICAAVTAGRSLAQVCAEPGRPHRTTVRNWRKAHPAFDEAMRVAFQHQRIGQRMRDRQVAAERAAARAARPTPRRGGKASGYTAALGLAICARLAEGQSLTSIAKDPAMPCYGTVYAWLKRHADFQEMYVEAREVQADYLFDEARDTALDATKDTVALARLRFDVTRWQAARLAPKKYLDRVVAAEELAEMGIGPRGGAARGPARGGSQEVVFHVTHFEVLDGRVLAAPPRNAREALAWVEATGAPYAEGVGPKGQIRPPPMLRLGGPPEG